MIYRLFHAAFERIIRNTDAEWVWGNCGRPCTTHHEAGEEKVYLICTKTAGLM